MKTKRIFGMLWIAVILLSVLLYTEGPPYLEWSLAITIFILFLRAVFHE